MRTFRICVALLVATFFVANQLPAQSAATLPIDSELRMGLLPNGMRYYIRQNAKPENRAELRLAVHAGSLQEDADQLGLAHFVEHMAFNGTKHFPKNDLVNYLESTGTRFGADLNAYTSFEETVYMIQARTDSLALLEKGLLILEDWAAGITFDPEEIDKERGVVISEWRSRLSPDQRMQQQYFPILYKGSRYAERLPIGEPAIIENAPYEVIRRFYERWYRPDLMAIVAVGDFDLDWMEMEIVQRFSRIERPATDANHEEYTMPRHKETLFAICSDPEASFTNAQVIYKLPEQPIKTVEDFQAQLARLLYNRMLGARLFELQQQPEPPFTFASSGYSSSLGDMDTYSAFAFTAEGKAMEGLRAVLLETRRAQLHGFTEGELERQKAEMLKAAENAWRERDKTQSAGIAMGYVYHFLRENPIPDAGQRLELYKKLLPKITIADINPLPAQWISRENRVVIITAPQKDEVPLPTKAELNALLDETDRATPPPYDDKVSDAALLEATLTSAKVTKVIDYQLVGVQELQLENGVKVVLKPTDFQNNEIRLSAFSPGGHSLYDDANYMNAANAASIIDLSGLGAFDAVALQKKLAGKNVRLSPYIAELYEGLNGSAAPDELETLLQLVYLYFTQPRRDSVAMQSFISRQRSIYQNMMVNPYYYFNEARSIIKYNNHPRRKMTKAEDLDHITLDGVYQVYQDRFADAGDFTFVLVGNFDTETIRPLLATYLGNLPTVGRQESWRDVNAALVPGRIDTTIVRGQAPKAIVELTWHGAFDFNNQHARYDFGALVDLLRIKLRESMREEQGGVYGVQVFGTPSLHPKQSYFLTISFQCEPGQADSLIQIARKDINNIKMTGAAETDLQKIRETQKQTRIKNLRENAYWSGQLVTRYQYGLPLDDILYEPYEQLVNQLSSKALQNAAQRYLDDTNQMRIVLLPAPQD
ncbi:MAG TPA: insulinase family protein [Saprospiraceae bacterium]|nr:insulinase family protein [Saprospiraceae bacterium]HMP25239.1 insulinase family protein [Saprospiraceae bacterium]